jgi:GR25 family glycosyltransferase involved in LPS biosynthesis
MNSILNKVYIIGNNHSSNKTKKLIKTLKPIEVNRWKQIKENNLCDNKINNITTSTCGLICSNKMIINWLTHYRLWKHIVKKEEDRVLILEDSAILTKNFKKKLEKLWNQVPHDWDIIYLGCQGSCGNTTTTDTYYKLMNMSNKDVDNNLIKPCFPLGLYAYIISYEGAKKLVEHENFKKVGYKLDYYLANHITKSDNFNAYAFIPPLSKKIDKIPKIKYHEILDPLVTNIKHTNDTGLSDILNTEVAFYRYQQISITYYSIIIAIVALLVGFLGDKKLKNIFMVSIFFIQLFEMGITKTNGSKLKTLTFELICTCIFYIMGYKLKQIRHSD